jgi:hypothetical protein
MYKRPSQRVRVNHDEVRHRDARVGSFLYNLINPAPTQYPLKIIQPVYHQDDYLKLLKTNNVHLGIPFVDPQLPILLPIVYPEPLKEPDLPFSDHVRVTLRILKSGIVRAKIYPSIALLHEKYWSKCIVPPLKPVLQAFKAYGFSDTFIKKVEKSQAKAELFKKKVGGILTKIFDKEPVKKVKKKKKQEEIIEERSAGDVDVDVDGDGDGDGDGDVDVPPVPVEPEEEETLDIEPDEDEEEEEEYVSDGGE